MNETAPPQEILRKLKSVFPEAVIETTHTGDDGAPCYRYALNEEFIRRLRGDADDRNRYELQFPEKHAANAAAFAPCDKVLVADKTHSKNFDATGNIFIEGDNLDALRLLQNEYRGKVKLIYIDPPYNTGGGFVYNDNFSVAQKTYLQQAGARDGETQTGLRGRFHARWLAFMYPRLKLARELLSDDGVIFISIDDREQANLKLICDEIFGEENFINLISTLINLKGNNSDAFFSGVHEYGLVYAKDITKPVTFNLLDNEEDWDNWNLDAHGYWKKGGILSASPGKMNANARVDTNNNFPVYVSADDAVSTRRTGADDVEVFPFSGGKKTRWYWSAKTFAARKNDIIVVRSKDGISLYAKQRMALNAIPQRRPKTVFYKPSYGRGTTDLKKALGVAGVFTHPKSVSLMKDILSIFTTRADDIVLDFFAGSATTAHALMQLNAEDGGTRKFILVQLPEEIDPEKFKEAREFCVRELKRPATLAEIAKERIRRAGQQIAEDENGGKFCQTIDTGFRAFVIRDAPKPKQKPPANKPQR